VLRHFSGKPLRYGKFICTLSVAIAPYLFPIENLLLSPYNVLPKCLCQIFIIFHFIYLGLFLFDPQRHFISLLNLQSKRGRVILLSCCPKSISILLFLKNLVCSAFLHTKLYDQQCFFFRSAPGSTFLAVIQAFIAIFHVFFLSPSIPLDASPKSNTAYE